MDEKKRAFLKVLFRPDPSPEEERIRLVRRSLARKRAEDGLLRPRVDRLRTLRQKAGVEAVEEIAQQVFIRLEAGRGKGKLRTREKPSPPARGQHPSTELCIY
jgi:hypothetical protein